MTQSLALFGRFFSHLIILVFFLFCSSKSSLAQRKWFTEVQEIESRRASADRAIGRVYVSEPYETTNPLFKPGSDLLQVEVQAIRRFLNNSADAKNKKLYLVRYGIDHQDVFQLLTDAKGQVARIVNLTDFNVFLNPHSIPKGEKYSTDYEKAERLPGKRSEGFDFLLSEGFKISGRKYGIFSQPLFDQSNDAMIPIMHEKATLLHTRSTRNGVSDKYKFLLGTNNLTDNRRVNRLWDIVDPTLAEYYLEHIQKMTSVFGQNGTIKDTSTNKKEVPPPLRVNYKDGS